MAQTEVAIEAKVVARARHSDVDHRSGNCKVLNCGRCSPRVGNPLGHGNAQLGQALYENRDAIRFIYSKK